MIIDTGFLDHAYITEPLIRVTLHNSDQPRPLSFRLNNIPAERNETEATISPLIRENAQELLRLRRVTVFSCLF